MKQTYILSSEYIYKKYRGEKIDPTGHPLTVPVRMKWGGGGVGDAEILIPNIGLSCINMNLLTWIVREQLSSKLKQKTSMKLGEDVREVVQKQKTI